MPYEEWKQQIDQLFKKRVGCDWTNLSGDEDQLRREYQRQQASGGDPNEFVSWFIEKYDLDEVSEFTY